MARFKPVDAVKIKKEHTHAINAAGSKAMRFYEGEIHTAEEIGATHRVSPDGVATALGHMVSQDWAEEVDADAARAADATTPKVSLGSKDMGAAPENK